MDASRTALVTGSVTGIGHAVVRALMADGWHVVIHRPDAGEATRVAEDVGALGSVAGDLTDPAVPGALIDAAAELGGGLEGLVNNAADTRRSALESIDASTFDHVMAVNVRAPLLLCQAALPHFRAAGRGSVVNVGSVNAHCGQRDLLAYSMSKGALTTMTRNLSDTWGLRRIRFNQVNPGWTLTENEHALRVAKGFPEDWPEHLPEWTAPSGRLIAPDEIAAIVALFMSDRVGPISGTVLDAHQFPMIGRNASKETT